MTTEVRCEIRDGVAVVALDGEARLNAFSGATGRSLGAALRWCDEEEDVRGVVLTGAGRAFCAGADLHAPAIFRPGENFDATPISPAPWQVRKLVVAAINGHAIGIGMTLAMMCDLRIASEQAQLSIPQVRRGMLGDAASHAIVPRAIGMTRAAEVLLTGRSYTGTEAAAVGIVNQVLPAERVLPAAIDLVREVTANASLASIALSKAILWRDAGMAAVAEAETRAHVLLMEHPDSSEASAAWREGREPRWTMRPSMLPTDLSTALFDGPAGDVRD